MIDYWKYPGLTRELHKKIIHAHYDMDLAAEHLLVDKDIYAFHGQFEGGPQIVYVSLVIVYDFQLTFLS